MIKSYRHDIEQSIFNVLNHKLMEAGAYVTIASGQTNAKGLDLSQFIAVSDPEMPVSFGQIYQSYFRNFTYESGVLHQPAPITISGVYVNGVFTPKSPSLAIDYENGRVFFSTPQPLGTIVQADFSYKEYSFIRPNPARFSKDETKFTSNSSIFTSGVPATPYVTYFPAIFMYLDSDSERGFQLGGTHESLPYFNFNILSEDLQQIEDIADVFQSVSTTSFPVVSATDGPKFNSVGDITENYSFYEWFKKSSNFAYIKSVKYNRFSESKKEEHQPKIYAGIVNVEISAIR